ncbi:glycosyltransferase family 87 protein [Tunturibacter empetritectus]|uniref:Glycosyltransferase RgtA/B/C/D-like domain-containing protein n=1 Tax=Tunturiibacter empetritectus TaxID=3069691 RepID=A0A7W8IER8_9BACT|nr:glycosyltransferase family 87 protein [Edaphobacter lichenicola]MBB5315812.1 hypothetical protein [Edaphobacter lichenicola]
MRILFALLTVWFAVFVTITIAHSIHWPMVHDSPILLYMVYLSEHGMRLYRDIVEVQFPGSLLLYSLERHLFGPGDLAFRLFDLCGLVVALASMLVITRRRELWFAAVFGFSFFVLEHTGTWASIIGLGQRDFFMTCLLGAGVAFLLESFHRQRPLLILFFGLSVALASTIKPTASVFLLLALPTVLALRKRQLPLRAYLGYLLAGFAAGIALILAYLLYEKALGAFLHLEWTMVPVYATTASMGFRKMLPAIFDPIHVLPEVAIGSLLLVALQPSLRNNLDQQVLLLASALGAASYFLQHKGFLYHRTPFYFFFFLWAGWVLVATIRQSSATYKWLALALVLFSAALYPRLSRPARWDRWNEGALQSDLVALHASDAPGEVQCLDVTSGCLNVLLQMNITMATGYVNDTVFFLDRNDARVEHLRDDFLAQLKKSNPRIIVLTNEQWPTYGAHGYEKLQFWPRFTDLLDENYVLSIQRGGDAQHERGYRIYLRKDTPGRPH